MDSIDFSIVVITYNQQDWVLETLESVRYQMENYSSTRTVQLIVADDGSADDTQARIKKWVSVYGELFNKVDLVFHESNVGTCKNVADGYRKVAGNHILSLAGDDLLGNCDIFSQVEKCGNHEIVADPPMIFNSSGVITDEKKYRNNMAMLLKSPKTIKRISKYGCPVVNGGYLGKDFYDESILKFSEGFKLLDDQARYLKLFEKYPDFMYRVSNEPILLYRESEVQITKRKGKSRTIILEDKRKLCEYALKTTYNPYYRVCIRMSYLQLKYPVLYRKFLGIFNPDVVINKVFAMVKYSKIVEMSKRIVEHAIENKTDQYLKDIEKYTVDFREKYLCQK